MANSIVRALVASSTVLLVAAPAMATDFTTGFGAGNSGFGSGVGFGDYVQMEITKHGENSIDGSLDGVGPCGKPKCGSGDFAAEVRAQEQLSATGRSFGSQPSQTVSSEQAGWLRGHGSLTRPGKNFYREFNTSGGGRGGAKFDAQEGAANTWVRGTQGGDLQFSTDQLCGKCSSMKGNMNMYVSQSAGAGARGVSHGSGNPVTVENAAETFGTMRVRKAPFSTQ